MSPRPATLYVQINEVFYNRATFPQLRISRLARDQAVINYRQTLVDVAFQVRQAFSTVLGASRSLELLRQITASQEKALSSTQQLFDAGKVEKSAVLQVEVTGNLNRRHRDDAELALTQARLALDSLLGEELPQDTHFVGELPTTATTPLDTAALTAEALKNRADLKLLESLRLSQNQQILVDTQNALPIAGFSSNSAFQPPALGLTSNFDLERNYNEPEVQRQEGDSQLPLSLYCNWLIFDGGNAAGVHASDQAQVETQDVAIDVLKHSIPGEIASAVSAIRAEQGTLQILNGGPIARRSASFRGDRLRGWAHPPTRSR